MGRSGSGWVGVVFFLVIVLGGTIFPPIAAFLSNLTGLPISTGAIYVVVIVASIALPPLIDALRRAGQRQNSPMSQPMSQPMAIPRTPQTIDLETLRREIRQQNRTNRPVAGRQNLPVGPRYEPIFPSWAIPITLIGAVMIGVGVFALSDLLLSGAL